jgi:hypothetical protein
MHVCNPPLAVIAAKTGGRTEPKLNLLTIDLGPRHSLKPVGVCNITVDDDGSLVGLGDDRTFPSRKPLFEPRA